MAKYYSIFAQMLFDVRFEVEYFDLEPSFFCFVYYIGHRGLLFTLMTNLEAGTRFADIWFNVVRYLKGETFEWHLKTGQVYGRSRHHFVLTTQINWGKEYRTFWYSE